MDGLTPQDNSFECAPNIPFIFAVTSFVDFFRSFPHLTPSSLPSEVVLFSSFPALWSYRKCKLQSCASPCLYNVYLGKEYPAQCLMATSDPSRSLLFRFSLSPSQTARICRILNLSSARVVTNGQSPIQGKFIYPDPRLALTLGFYPLVFSSVYLVWPNLQETTVCRSSRSTARMLSYCRMVYRNFFL